MLMCRSDKAWVWTPKSTSRLWNSANHDPGVDLAGAQNYRQLGSQISMFQVDCEIGMPVRIGYIHAKLVMTTAM